MLREFLPEAFQNVDESQWQRLTAAERLTMAENVIAEARRLLPIIRQTIGNHPLPKPPEGFRINDLELEVRTHNCLLALGVQDDLNAIGNLTINRLLATRNFGVKSLLDLLTALEFVGSENREHPEVKQPSCSNVSGELTREDVGTISKCHATQSQIPPNIRQRRLPQLPDGLRLDKRDLKNRTYNCLERAGFIERPRELSGQTIGDLLSLPTFGMESLVDLLTVLEPFLGSKEEDTERKSFAARELAAEAKLLEDIDSAVLITSDDPRLGRLLHVISPNAQNARDAAARLLDGTHVPLKVETVTDSIRQLRQQIQDLSQLTLEDELMSFLANAPNPRNSTIFARRFGFDGRMGATLQELADEFGMTREGIRQVCESLTRQFDGRRPFAPVLDKALDLVGKKLPAMAADIESLLVSERIAGKPFRLESLQRAAKRLGRDVPYSVAEPGQQRIALTPGSEYSADKVLQVARRAIEHWGAATVEEVTAAAAEQSGLPPALVLRIIAGQDDFRWLDERTGWFWLHTIARNRLVNQIEKILSVTEEVDIGELRAGVRRHHRMEGIAPPKRVLLELCNQLPWCLVEDECVKSEALDWRTILSETEQIMVEVLKTSGPVMQRERFEEECLLRGMNRTTFYAYLNYSPVITKFDRGVYGLRGVRVQPNLIESLKPTLFRSKVLKDSGWTDEGTLWVGFKLSESAVLSGACNIPPSLTTHIRGQFKLLSPVTKSFIGTLATSNSSAWGLGHFFDQKGVEAGDYLVLVFDLKLLEAVAHLGDETLLADFQAGVATDGDDQHVGYQESPSGGLVSQDSGLAEGERVSEAVIKPSGPTTESNVWYEITDGFGLKTLDMKWREYLLSDACPPVPGLAPLSDEESDQIGRMVAAHSELLTTRMPSWRILLDLLKRFPACLAVWLARKAGEAYESGAFWEKFGELVGTNIPMTQREELAKRFRHATWTTMTTWLPPIELGGHNIVSQLLHQAGLPLDRCAGFAQLVRKVERSFGLPDIGAPDAGEQLRDAIVEDLQAHPVPTLRRALQGPAGASICELALEVVLKADFTGVNPRLGQELERVFQDSERGSLRRSASQPFLRLGTDLGSLEIVGPRQDSSLVGDRGLTWIVDGRRYPTPRTEEFVSVVTTRPRVVLELAGLRHGNMPPRTFALRLNDLAEPFMLFDERTRKHRRITGLIPPGSYWLLHRVADTLVGAEHTYAWPADERSLSQFTIRPGMSVRLESDAGGPWPFAATLTPFFEPVGESLAHEEGEPVYFDWAQMPCVWLRKEETECERLEQWAVCLSHVNEEHRWRLSRTEDQAGAMVKCRVESGDFLARLSSGMCRFDLVLRRGERGRTEVQAEYWYWQGLKGHNAREFQLLDWPQNLLTSDSRGFGFETLKISHLKDQYRRHTLSFQVGDNRAGFHWTQPGVFLESLERSAGQHARPRSHRLGEAFSASLTSSRWLRIWIAGYTNWEVLIAGRSWQKAAYGDAREFVELSVANLALTFPQGGDVSLRVGTSDRLVARFSSPLQPFEIVNIEDDAHLGFRFEFSKPVVWARPVVRELGTGKRWSLEGQQLDTASQCGFASPEFPSIECEGPRDSEELINAGCNPVTMRVPKRGWPAGFWLIELETRRDEQSEWERVVLHGDEHAPAVISNHQSDLATTRASLFWGSYPGGSLSELAELDDEGRTDLFELIAELIELRQRGMVSGVRRDLGWLKEAVRSLSQLAGRIARQPNGEQLQLQLLNLACQDPNHAGFVYLPVLLALTGNVYRELPSGDTLNDALRLCGSVAISDSIADLARHDFAFFDMSVLRCFANFMKVASPEQDAANEEFQHFDHETYWLQVLGPLRSDRLAADWSGEGVLGKAHLVWALEEFVKRYETSTHDLQLGAANALLRSAGGFRTWLQGRLAAKSVMSTVAWKAPWPRFEAPDVDFLESAPRFASLFALAARAAAAGWLEFDEALKWLEGRVDRRWMVEEGIAVLVGLAPELFGHQLLFWELMVRTAPQEV